MNAYKVLSASTFALAASVVASGSALAQDAAGATDAAAASDDAGFEEIVVTAQHRAESIQTTPLAVSALRGEELADRQIANVQALSSAVPNVNFSTYNNSTRVAIRGIGDDAIAPGAEARTAFHVDGVYSSRPQGAMAGFLDVDRVEVVRGPQGTLYGRNATGGAINVITENPTDTLEGYVNATVGNYELARVSAAISGPIAEDLSGRLAIQSVSRGGYGRDTTTGQDIDDEHSWAARAKVRHEFSANSDLILAADYFNEDDHSGGWHYLGAGAQPELGDPGLTPFPITLGGALPSDPRDSTANLNPSTDREAYGLSATFNFDLGWAQLTSISAYRSLEDHVLTDYDMTDLDLALYDISESSDQYSQEVRLQGAFDGGHWLVGGYYFNESDHGQLAVPLDQALYFSAPGYVQGYYIAGDIETEAYAVFGQADFALTDAVSFVVGARYSEEEKSISEGLAFDTVTPYTGTIAPGPLFTNEDTHTWSAFTPRVSLEFRPTSDIFAYLTYARGFKSGGFNLGGLQAPFAPENVTDYEAGVKADWFDNRLRTNLAIFRYEYSDLQVNKVVGAIIVTDNAAEAELYGAELEVAAMLTPHLEVGLNVALLHSEYTSFINADPAHSSLGDLDLSGNALNQSPEYNVMLSVQYDVPFSWGDLTLRAEGYAVDQVYFTPYNQAYVGQDAYEKYNLFATFEPSGQDWTLRLFGRNLSDETTKASSVVGSGLAGFPISGSYDPPRTYGAEFSYRF